MFLMVGALIAWDLFVDHREGVSWPHFIVELFVFVVAAAGRADLEVAHLETLLDTHRGSAVRALIVTDSLFSMDGDQAPLGDLASLGRDYDAGLLVDEAHALGVFGPSGRGLCAAAGVVPDVLIGTLGKAFGVAGAFAAGSTDVVSFLRSGARSFVYSTAPPPAGSGKMGDVSPASSLQT